MTWTCSYCGKEQPVTHEGVGFPDMICCQCEGPAYDTWTQGVAFKNPNRTIDRFDFDWNKHMRRAADDLISVGRALLAKGGRFSTWVGTLDKRHRKSTLLNRGEGISYNALPWWPWDDDIPWFTLWEYSWILAHVRRWCEPRLKGEPALEVLSLGGSACLLDAALAADGHRITLLERRAHTCEQAAHNARRMGWRYHVEQGPMETSMGRLPPQAYDCMTSSNVLFLAGSSAQVAVATRLHGLIRPGGRAFFTFDYLNPNPERLVTDPLKHFRWDGFKPIVPYFHDGGHRTHCYYPEPEKGWYTAGALLQERV